VGAGRPLGGWSFATALNKTNPDLGPNASLIPFGLEEIFSALHESIQSLHLPGVEIRDEFFVSGADIRDDRTILPDIHGRPIQVLTGESAYQYMNANDGRIRRYKWILVKDWGNELILSYFLRCSCRGAQMFVEIERFLLPPLADQYRKVDGLVDAGWHKRVAMLVESLIIGPFFLLGSALALLSAANESIGNALGNENRHRQREIDDNPLYNYGTDVTIREAAASDKFAHYFQKADGEFYRKVLDHQILGTIINFLDDHNIDTAEIKERRTVILNSGIIVQGGDVTAESLAVGVGAQATTIQSQPSTREKTRSKAAGA
jgi:hypothetical protein